MSNFDPRASEFQNAVRTIERRAERQQDEVRLVKTFVPNKVLEDLKTSQNQLIFGRRGVGKTHTLKAYLGNATEKGALCHYLDCTTFGSGLGADGSPMNVGIRFFSKFLGTLADKLLEDAVRTEYPKLHLQDELESTLHSLANLGTPSASGETFQYTSIVATINRFLVQIGAERLTVLVDEWAAIPVPSQPYFAEFLKRAFFANPSVTVKIGVVDYTYNLGVRHGDTFIGLERSADIFTDIRMDTYFVWNEDRVDEIEQFFAEVLYSHLAAELCIDHNLTPAQRHDAVLNGIFTQRRVLSELCRAAEGNARDFLVIFGRAYGRFHQQGTHERVGMDNVYQAAIEWFRNEKSMNIATERSLEAFLEHLVHSIIRDRKARTFMVPSVAREHPLLKRLFSARILHPLNLEWSHPDRPGERYFLITMDYGTYASFKNTKNEPQLKLFWATDDPDAQKQEDLVPFDDRRSIRRIVVGEDVLDRYWDANRNAAEATSVT